MSKSVAFKEDGLDFVFYGALGLVLGQVLSFGSTIIGVILSLLGMVAFVYGLYLFRADYRTKAVRKEAPAPPQEHKCPNCGADLTFVEQYGRWYCQTEQKYV